MPTSRIIVKVSGPLFDGRAAEAVRRWLDATRGDLTDQGEQQLRQLASQMNKTGRARGHAVPSIHVTHGSYMNMIEGQSRQGEVWWPWLEGTSHRNQTTRFKGYHAFRKVRLALRREALPEAQRKLDAYIGEMGGRP